MKEKSIKFELAVEVENLFLPNYFGNADKLLNYEWKGNELIFVQETVNPFKTGKGILKSMISAKCT